MTKQNEVISGEEIVMALAKEMLTNMGLEQEIHVSKVEDSFNIDIEGGETAGLLIGKQGQTLQSLQSLLNSMYKQKTGEWARIVVNVADWKEKEEKRLTELALGAAQRAKETGEAQNLYNLTPSQRRIVHMTLSEDDTVETVSEGEQNERYLVVRAK